MPDDIIAQILSALNRIEKKVDDNQVALVNHIAEEMEEKHELHNLITCNREDAEKRHTALIMSINSYMDKQEEMCKAFLQRDGEPDYSGHHDDHASRKAVNDRLSKVKDEAVAHVAKTGLLAFCVWFLYIVWDSLLRGPK